MKQKSNFSVLIPTRWASKYLEQCIKYINKFSKFDNEILIGADLPSWQTLKFLQDNTNSEKYNFRYIITNYGHQCMVWNTLIQYTSKDNEYVIITGDDVIFGPGWDIALTEIIEKEKGGGTIIGGLREYNPEIFKIDITNNDISNNLEQFIKFGLDRIENKFVEGMSWPMLINKYMFEKYGGLTFASSREHNHDVRLANRITKGENGKCILNLKSFSYHFGHTGNTDKIYYTNLLSKEYKNGIRICKNCKSTKEGFGDVCSLENSLELENIFDKGYWLCDKCRNLMINI